VSGLDTNPAIFDCGSGETLPIAIDVSNYLAAGDSVTSPAATLVNMSTGVVYAAGLSGSPSIVGNIITQTVTALATETRYRLTVSFTANTGKIMSADLILNCVF
jgi:hypothetical protein